MKETVSGVSIFQKREVPERWDSSSSDNDEAIKYSFDLEVAEKNSPSSASVVDGSVELGQSFQKISLDDEETIDSHTSTLMPGSEENFGPQAKSSVFKISEDVDPWESSASVNTEVSQSSVRDATNIFPSNLPELPSPSLSNQKPKTNDQQKIEWPFKANHLKHIPERVVKLLIEEGKDQLRISQVKGRYSFKYRKTLDGLRDRQGKKIPLEDLLKYHEEIEIEGDMVKLKAQGEALSKAKAQAKSMVEAKVQARAQAKAKAKAKANAKAKVRKAQTKEPQAKEAQTKEDQKEEIEVEGNRVELNSKDEARAKAKAQAKVNKAQARKAKVDARKAKAEVAEKNASTSISASVVDKVAVEVPGNCVLRSSDGLLVEKSSDSFIEGLLHKIFKTRQETVSDVSTARNVSEDPSLKHIQERVVNILSDFERFGLKTSEIQSLYLQKYGEKLEGLRDSTGKKVKLRWLLEAQEEIIKVDRINGENRYCIITGLPKAISEKAVSVNKVRHLAQGSSLRGEGFLSPPIKKVEPAPSRQQFAVKFSSISSSSLKRPSPLNSSSRKPDEIDSCDSSSSVSDEEEEDRNSEKMMKWPFIIDHLKHIPRRVRRRKKKVDSRRKRLSWRIRRKQHPHPIKIVHKIVHNNFH